MSISWRQWIAMASNQRLGITQKERDAIKEKPNVFCGIGDSKIKKEAGKTASIDKIFDEMPEEQKRQFSKEVIDEGLILLGIRKKKVKKENKEEELTV